MKCPKCGSEMHFFYGNMWDHDMWCCMKYDNTKPLGKRHCDGCIELDQTTIINADGSTEVIKYDE